MNTQLKELSLFTGGGGGLLGSKILNWKTIGAVEIETYPCKILEKRQKDGCLENFPIWNMDIKFFNKKIAPIYKGMVDIITGGFPCQDISSAGKGAGITKGTRSGLWFDMAKSIRITQPKYVFVENSPLLVHRGLGIVLASLSKMGYNARWGIIPASAVGALHERKRIWIFAYTNSQRPFSGIKLYKTSRNKQFSKWTSIKIDFMFKTAKHTIPKLSENLRISDGLARDVDKRLHAIGNGQVPLCMAYAFKILSEGIIE